VLDARGEILSQSQDMVAFPAGLMPEPQAGIREVQAQGGAVYSVLTRPWFCGSDRGLLLLRVDRTHEEGLVREFRRTLALGVLLAAGLAAILARAIARWGLAPLAALIRETSSISDRNLDRRLTAEHFPHELQELVATLNAALARLQSAFEQVSHLGAELAHELRTPLQNLRGALENRVLRASSEPVQPAELGALLEDCDRMAAIIEQILFLARSEAGPTTLQKVPIGLDDLLTEVHSFFEAAAEEAGVALHLQVAPGLSLKGDHLLLTRALHNLVANALRHTPAGGTVRLGAEGGPGGIVLFVEDTGGGIPAEWVPRLGQPFARPQGSRSEGGLGLGLAIVRRIAFLLDGTMAIQSQVGVGTRVALRFP
jgi:two-component system heavy metal sensor histidine kinase CusS